MRGVLHWSLWQRRWSVLWWSIGITAFIVLQLAFYPTIRDQQAELEKSFEQLPEGAVALFSDTGDFFSPVGYLSGQIFYLMMPLLLGALAIGIGASLIAREEKEGTLELLLSRPLSRPRLLIAKALCGILIVVGVGVVASVITAAMSELVNLPVYFDQVVLAGLASTLLAIVFGSVALMVTTLGSRARGAAIAVAGIYAIAGYLLTSLADTIDWLKWPAKLFPFDYYRPAEILQGTYSWINLSVYLLILVLVGFISWRAFSRRDLSS